MIVLDRLSKRFRAAGRSIVVADAISATFPSGVAVALLGRNGAGKSTLLQMIAGTSRPDRGRVLTDGRVSYPVGLASALHPDLTGAQNTRFVARIYGADTGEVTRFVEAFAQLGAQFRAPVRTYYSGMRARLAFGINMALDFDTYLIDEVTGAGDQAFQDRARAVFTQRMAGAGALFVSHSIPMLRRMCRAGAVLDQGRLSYFDDLEDAIAAYRAVLHRDRDKDRDQDGHTPPQTEAAA